MADDPIAPRARQVPRGRISRLSQFGRLAGGVAGGMLAEGARRLADGERPRLRDMMLTPGNVGRVADRLSHLRGAAMKLGQMISMDAGDMLPAELSTIMARLRDNAHHMPPAQLQQVLAAQWGKDWRTRFQRFDPSRSRPHRSARSTVRSRGTDASWRSKCNIPACAKASTRTSTMSRPC
jgi:predicted unusual protein kinase regulating ubiquinone biosynthesis (AarF/ABC1/UbiB family)